MCFYLRRLKLKNRCLICTSLGAFGDVPTSTYIGLVYG